MIFSIIGFAALAHLMVEFFQHLEINTKPWSCNLCFGFWLSLLPMVIMYGGDGFLAAAMTGVTSEVIYRLIQRL
jgi:hypothetical protein